MKKSELKNIIKECVKEVIFEEGVLSGIITEVAHGLQGSQMLTSGQTNLKSPPVPERSESANNKMSETRKRMQEAMNQYNQQPTPAPKPAFAEKNPLFEGTQALPEGDGKGAMSGMNPNDPGLDISNIPGMGNWGTVAGRLNDN